MADDSSNALVHLVGVAVFAVGIAASTGVGLPMATGPLQRLVALLVAVVGAGLAYVGPDPKTALGDLFEAGLRIAE